MELILSLFPHLKGSDSEAALVSSLKKNFGHYLWAVCTAHLEANALNACIATDPEEKSKLLDLLFHEDYGLAASLTPEEFQRRKQEIDATKFKNFEYLASRIYDGIVHIRIHEPRIQLYWKTQDVESKNHCIKRHSDWQPLTLQEMLNMIRELMKKDLDRLKMAFYGCGEWELTEDKKKTCLVTKETWEKMSDKARMLHVKRFFKIPTMAAYHRTIISEDGNLELPVQAKLMRKKPNVGTVKRGVRTRNNPNRKRFAQPDLDSTSSNKMAKIDEVMEDQVMSGEEQEMEVSETQAKFNSFIQASLPKAMRTNQKEASSKKAPVKKAHACNKCEKSFDSDRGLQIHKSRIHKEKPKKQPTVKSLVTKKNSAKDKRNDSWMDDSDDSLDEELQGRTRYERSSKEKSEQIGNVEESMSEDDSFTKEYKKRAADKISHEEFMDMAEYSRNNVSEIVGEIPAEQVNDNLDENETNPEIGKQSKDNEEQLSEIELIRQQNIEELKQKAKSIFRPISK